MMNQSIAILICILLVFTLIQEVNAVTSGGEVPNCPLTLLDNAQPYPIEQHQGKVLYIDFWSSWCSPCAKSFPFMNKLNRELKDQGLQIIGVNLDEYPDNAQKFLAKFPNNFSIAADLDGRCAKSFDVKAMPSSYLVDRNGIIRHVHIGFRAGETQELREMVEQLLAETPTNH